MIQPQTPTQTAQKALSRLADRYIAAHPKSKALSEKAKAFMPGGNTRTGAYMPPFPIYLDQGEGVYVIDADGHRLMDWVNNNTALILGHAHPAIVTALQDQAARGTAFSRPTQLEIEMAALLQQHVPSLEHLRFCSSGTEAVIQALRVAKTFTEKNKIAKFEGAYHGVGEYALISYMPPLDAGLGPADAPNPVPSSTGITPNITDEVIILPFNNPEVCDRIIAHHADDLAAIIVDPLSTGAGFTPPQDGFLTKLRALADQAGAVLIFDEIISFRAAPGGAQHYYDVRPDLTCLAKVIAGGTAGAAFGGRADIMTAYDPTQGTPQIPHSGTYSGNPLSMVAGLATLQTMTPQAYNNLESKTQKLGADLQNTFNAAGVIAQVTTIGSLFRIHFLPEKPLNYRQAALNDATMARWFYLALLERGMHWADHGNVSLPTTNEDIAAFIGAVQDALSTL
jgi:glutamate-1-semialdehyde 2,1-aminomutase